MDKIEKYQKLGAKAQKGNIKNVEINVINDLIDLMENYDPNNSDHVRARKDISVMVEAGFKVVDGKPVYDQKDLDFLIELRKYMKRRKKIIENEIDELENA